MLSTDRKLTDRRTASLNGKPSVVMVLLILCLVLTGCSGGSQDSDSGGQESSDDINSDQPAGDDTAPGDGPANVSVPESYVSSANTEPTVQAVRDGLNPYDVLIGDTFSCFDEDADSMDQPDLQLVVNGSSYASTAGNGSIQPSESYGDIEFVGGPLDEEIAYVNFDDYGQRFAVDYGRLDLECFQHGASLERAQHRFLLNTPEAASYECRDVESDDVQLLTLSGLTQNGGRYDTNGSSGTYVLSDRVDGSTSRLEFDGGPLDSDRVSYSENADSGRQSFRISETRTFGIAVAASSSLTYVCARNRTPRPFKQYGNASAGSSPMPSIALSGRYYVADIQVSVSSSYLEADLYHFRSDGFVAREPEGRIGHDCDRTAPNGLNYCDSYDVQGDRLIINRPAGGAPIEFDIVLSPDNRLLELDGTTAELVTSNPVSLDGVWSNNSYFSSGCFGIGFCSFSYSERVLRLSNDGRFIKQSSSQSGSDLTTAIGSTSAFGTSSNDSTGNYQIIGNRLLLSYDNGDSENVFLYQTQDGDLVVGDLLYIPGDLSD